MNSKVEHLKAMLREEALKFPVTTGSFHKTYTPLEAKPIFIGVSVPSIRKIAKNHLNLSNEESLDLLRSNFHEERLLALILWSLQYPKLSQKDQKKLVDLYLNELDFVNQWDLVDQSAPYLFGKELDQSTRKEEALELIKSPDWYRRRVPVVASLIQVRRGTIDLALKYCHLLVFDSHELLHKAVGWLLREVGKKDLSSLRLFLDEFAHSMPRTALRYSLEKFPEEERLHYMYLGKVKKSFLKG